MLIHTYRAWVFVLSAFALGAPALAQSDCLQLAGDSLSSFQRSLSFAQHYGDAALNAELTDYLAKLNQLSGELSGGALEAAPALKRLRAYSENLSGYRLPFPWWQSLWFSNALGIEDQLTACLSTSANDEDLYLLVARARWAAAAPALDWKRIELPVANRALTVAAEIDAKLGRALSTSPPKLEWVSDAWSALRRARYLLPKSDHTWLDAEHLLSRALGKPAESVATDYIPRNPIALTLPLTCWSDSISVTSGEDSARANLADRCAKMMEDLTRLRIAGGSVSQGVQFQPYTNISPWGRNPNFIPMVFDYLLVVNATLTLQTDGAGLKDIEGPAILSDTYTLTRDDAEISRSQNIADAYQSWWKRCTDWLWQRRVEAGSHWVAGDCGAPSFTAGADYYKTSQVRSNPHYWMRQD